MAAQKKPTSSKNTNNSKYIQPRIISEVVLFSWNAKSRPFIRKSKEHWVSIFAIAIILGFILFLIESTATVIMVIAVVFLYFVLNTVEPDVVQYAITNKGINIADKKNPIEMFSRFWFTKRGDDDILMFETFTIPNRLELVINVNDKSKIRKILSNYLVEEEAPPTRAEKAAQWLSKKIEQKAMQTSKKA